MSLLHEIQQSILNDGSELGPIFLKLRLLAAGLGSEVLEEWISHESQGYPSHRDVPDYRQISISYTGTFWGPFGASITNAQIPSRIIEEYAGSSWVNYKMRQGVAAIDYLLKGSSDRSGRIVIDASNLTLLLQGKVYEDYACNAVKGIISRSSIAEINYAVRSRILQFLIEIEKSFPEVLHINIGSLCSASNPNPAKVTQIYNQIFYGDITTVSNAENGAVVTISIKQNDDKALIEYLLKAGFPSSDAKDFAEIVASEKPVNSQDPLSEKAKDWLKENIKKAANGTWKMGVTVVTKTLVDAVKQYYGIG
jgi:hypothetical protein